MVKKKAGPRPGRQVRRIQKVKNQFMPRLQSRCWFFTAIVHWDHLEPDQIGDHFLKVIDGTGQCSAGLDMLAFSYDERDFDYGPDSSIERVIFQEILYEAVAAVLPLG